MVTIIGLGFVGITTALYLSERKNITVYGIDSNLSRTEEIKKGHLPFYEPNLENLLQKHLNKDFFVSDDMRASINQSEYIFICVGTNMGDNGIVDLNDVYKVIDEITKNMDSYKTIVIKSSVPPTTTIEKIIPYIESKGLKFKTDFGIAYNPEFLQEGYCYDEIMHGDRIVIGTEDQVSLERMNELYLEQNNANNIFNVSIPTAEFCKYLSNSFLAVVISYANELAKFADTVPGLSIEDAFKIFHQDRRWNNCKMTTYVYPGGQFGGYCLPKDIAALNCVAKAKGITLSMIQNAMDINNSMPNYLVDKIMSNYHENDKIGILGLSFKENSDDVRKSPASEVIRLLNERGITNIYAYDPVAIANFKNSYPNLKVNYLDSYEELIAQSDIITVVKMWKEFVNLSNITNKKIIDGPRLLKWNK